MKIQKNKVVDLHYTMRLDHGDVIDTTKDEAPLPYLHGVGNIMPGLEAALEGRQASERFTVTVEPEDAFGLYDEELVDEIPVDSLPDNMEFAEGDVLHLVGENDEEVDAFIEHIGTDAIILNYNHPLAGERVTIDVEIIAIREPTAEELAHGHAHDPYDEEGCDHG